MANDVMHKWSFRRLGGLDQVVLESSEDFCRLRELDPKLWVALSCPASGLEFDARTLALIDTDKDGRIRIPEMVEAVEWACERLKDPATLKNAADCLPIEAVRDDTDEGRHLIATMHAILENLGKPEETGLSQADVQESAAHAAEHLYNGDGIIPPLESVEADLAGFIQDAMKVVGGVKDAGGQYGINTEIARAYLKLLTDWTAWQEQVGGAASPLGKDTAGAWDLMQEVKGKIDDYFLRAELAAYAPQAQAALNVDEKYVVPSDNGILSAQALAELPLSQVGADKPLNLVSGLNPEWRARIERFAALVAPLLEKSGELSRKDWLHIQKTFEPYAAALSQKPARPDVEVELQPVSSPEQLDARKIETTLHSDLLARFTELSEKDSSMPAAAADIAGVERLVLYHKYLYRLLMNFISFFDFYNRNPRAAFQIGTLYIDGRSCELCLPVEDVAKHTILANLSQLFLIYCECTRRPSPVSKEPKEKKTIVAAVTAGDSDLLIENRHGVFVDNQGNDWDATVIKVASNPISLKQAIFDPYKRFGRMVSEQVGKFASSKNAEMLDSAGKQIGAAGAAVTQPAVAAPQKFDIGRNVGIFAAIGLAIGAIGTALASIAGALFSLQWWQFPLVFLGLFLLVSGPSLIMAWLKLRQRTLGPLLEASGWAVNGRVFISFFLGRQLTGTAQLPDNANRSYVDPLAKRKHWPLVVFLLAVLLGAGAVGGWLWYKSNHETPGQTAQSQGQSAPREQSSPPPATVNN